MTEPTMFYYGPWDESGHYFFTEDGVSVTRRAMEVVPWGYEVDGALQPKGTFGPEGVALLHHKNGWTAIAFWDRTVDTRPASCSTYVAEGIFTFEEMVVMAKARFAHRWNKMKFEVRQASP